MQVELTSNQLRYVIRAIQLRCNDLGDDMIGFQDALRREKNLPRDYLMSILREANEIEALSKFLLIVFPHLDNEQEKDEGILTAHNQIKFVNTLSPLKEIFISNNPDEIVN